ncbi:MAG: RNase J family beta-CASP ribonuclease [Candidatus Vogelbacteria bacterium]|nr:RNase J family beta-CASP ribonuclease [Candidatus Vogelbacteria bacterium]
MNYPRRQYRPGAGDTSRPAPHGKTPAPAAGQRNHFSASPTDRITPYPPRSSRPAPVRGGVPAANRQPPRPAFGNPYSSPTRPGASNKGPTGTWNRRPASTPWPAARTSSAGRPGATPFLTTRPGITKGTGEKKASKHGSRQGFGRPRKKTAFDRPLPDEFNDLNMAEGETETGEEKNSAGSNQERPRKIPPLAPGDIRIIPLGGVEEIGKNMTAIEMDGDILIVDEGLLFPGEDAPGVDYIIPDTTYLEERKHLIRGVIVTHGHLDHIGGVPYIQPKLGNPPIYTSLLTAVMIKKRQEEFPHLPKLNLQVVDKKDVLRLGHFRVRFFETTHTIPDSLGTIIETPYGNIIVTGDFKLDHQDGVVVNEEREMFEKLGQEKNLLLMAESTNVERPGFSFSEKEVQKNVREIVEKAKGRVIIGSFSSLFERIFYIILACEEIGKKVAIEGRSMKTNVDIAQELGILKVKKGTIISTDTIDDFPDDRIVILATGAQGDDFAALMRMSQKEHRAVKIKRGDTVLLSSSVIPGNEKSVQKLKDNLSRLGAKIIHYGIAAVHSSGHSYQGELLWVEKMLKPKFFVPMHGHHFHLRIHADVAMEAGILEKNIVVPDNGSLIEITDNGEKIHLRKETVPANVIMVDGLGTNNVKEVVIRDRQMLAEDGMFVLIAIIDMKSGKVRKSPDIISRGFIYLKESQDLLRHVRLVTKKTIEEATTNMHPINLDYLKNAVREELGKYLFQKTHKRPIILPVLIEV